MAKSVFTPGQADARHQGLVAVWHLEGRNARQLGAVSTSNFLNSPTAVAHITHTSRGFRYLASASTALFGGQMETISTGDPVTGVMEATSGNLQTAQLSGWGGISVAEWKLLPPPPPTLLPG